MKRAPTTVLLALLLLAPARLPAQLWQGSAALGIEASGRKQGAAAGALVILRYQQMEPPAGPRPARTDERGRAVFSGLAEGSWEVEVSHPDFLSFVALVELRRGRKPTVTASFLQASGSSLTPMRVRLVDAAGKAPSPPVAMPPEAELPRIAARPSPPPEESPAPPDEPGPSTRRQAESVADQPEPELRPLPSSALAQQPTETAEAAPATPQPASPPGSEAAAPEPAPAESLPEPAEKPHGAEPAAAAPRPEPPAAAPEQAAPAPTAPPAAPPTEAEPLPRPPQPAEPMPAPVEQKSAAADPERPKAEAAVPPPAALRPEPAPAAPPGTEPEPEPPPAPRPEPPPPAPPRPEPQPTPPPEPRPEPPAPEPEPEPEPEPQPPPPAPEPAAPPEPVSPAPAAAPEPPPEPAPAAPPPAEPEETPLPPPAPPAPTSRVTAPGPLGEQLRAYRDQTCVECRPGEWSLSVEVVAGPGGPEADCPDGRFDEAAALTELLGNSVALELKAVAATASQAAGYLDDEAAAGTLLGDREQSCRLLAVVLPKAGRFRGVRLEAADASGVGDCLADKDCPVGAAAWIGNPQIAREPNATLIWGLFINRSPDRERRARMTVYFSAPSRTWSPPRR